MLYLYTLQYIHNVDYENELNLLWTSVDYSVSEDKVQSYLRFHDIISGKTLKEIELKQPFEESMVRNFSGLNKIMLMQGIIKKEPLYVTNIQFSSFKAVCIDLFFKHQNCLPDVLKLNKNSLFFSMKKIICM